MHTYRYELYPFTVCTSFQNLGICEDKIYENGIQDGQVERFCRCVIMQYTECPYINIMWVCAR